MKTLVVDPPHNFIAVEKEKPTIKKDQVLLKIKYAGICGSDGMLWNAPMVPKAVLGHEFCGWIEDPGSFNFKKGDRVCVPEMNPCGTCEFCKSGREQICPQMMQDCPGVTCDGAFAEYLAIRGDLVIKLPDDVSFELAALTEPIAVSLHGVKRSKITAGETFLVWGNGPIGAYAAFCAKKLGVSKVYMVGRGQKRVDLCNTFDFVDKCFSVKDADFNEKLAAVTPPGGFSYVVDALGNCDDFDTIVGKMKSNGNLVLLGLHTPNVVFSALSLLAKEINVYPGFFFTLKEFNEVVGMLAGSKDALMKTITSTVPLDAAKMQALFLKLFESGQNDDYKVLVDLEL